MTTPFREIAWWEEAQEAWKKACGQGLLPMVQIRFVVTVFGRLSTDRPDDE